MQEELLPAVQFSTIHNDSCGILSRYPNLLQMTKRPPVRSFPLGQYRMALAGVDQDLERHAADLQQPHPD